MEAKMIDPKSLRIGNYFRMRGGKMIQTVFEILDNTDRGRIKFDSPEHEAMYSHLILCRENRNQYKPWEMEGIPLSEQELIRLGFQFIVASSWSTATEVKYKCWTNGRLTFNEIQDTWWFYGRVLDKQLQFVHHLQNFHYVMTGTELTYKVENETIKP